MLGRRVERRGRREREREREQLQVGRGLGRTIVPSIEHLKKGVVWVHFDGEGAV